MASSINYVTAVADNLATRLHRSGTEYRCRCGACRHIVLVSARRSGLDPQRLMAALPPERPLKRDERPPRRRAMTSPVSSSMTVSSGGHRYQGITAMLAVLGSR